jgi:hypothetical protein
MKILKHLLTISMLAALVVKAQPTSGLVGYYPFSGNANDATSNSYHGTVNGASLATDRKGSSNSAYQFNGTSNYVLLGNSFDYAERTVSAWFNAADISSSAIGVIYSSDNKDLTNGMTAMYVKKINNVNKIIINASDIIDTADITLEEWHNIIVTVTAASATIYLDGVSIGTKSINTKYHSVDFSTKATIGTSRALTNGFFNGKVDNIRIYNRVLNSTELTQLYTLGINQVIKPNSFSIYPNPASTSINMNFKNTSGLTGYTVEISNSLSQLVYSASADGQKLSIDCSALGNKGLYFVQLKDQYNNIVDVQKLVLQ